MLSTLTRVSWAHRVNLTSWWGMGYSANRLASDKQGFAWKGWYYFVSSQYKRQLHHVVRIKFWRITQYQCLFQCLSTDMVPFMKEGFLVQNIPHSPLSNYWRWNSTPSQLKVILHTIYSWAHQNLQLLSYKSMGKLYQVLLWTSKICRLLWLSETSWGNLVKDKSYTLACYTEIFVV